MSWDFVCVDYVSQYRIVNELEVVDLTFQENCEYILVVFDFCLRIALTFLMMS